MPMGMADVATVLFTRFLKFDAAAPDWPDRDRFVLSAGHGSMLLYALLHLTGYPGVTMDELRNFRQLGSMTAGHPEYGHAPGIETTTGPLGQGLANAVGMALAERLLNARLGDGIVDHHTYVLAGDGCLMEGISHETISLAGHLKLNKLIVLFDDNHISIDGPTELAVSDDQLMRFEASGWTAVRVDGHDPEAVAAAIERARTSDRPTLIACRTVIGYGAPTKAGKASTHGSPLGAEEIAGARDKLGWAHAPFAVPSDVLAAWRACGARGAPVREAWTQRWQGLDPKVRVAVEHPARAAAPAIAAAIAAAKTAAAAATAKKATRVWSEAVLDRLIPALPALIGGSADLTGSNNTRIKDQPLVAPGSFAGSYIHYGVREHAMAAAMNGIALHGGLIPYGGTFLVFTDYCRPAIRLSALMRQRVIYVMTHDSIGLGEDGPTHQPVEHLASLRADPQPQRAAPRRRRGDGRVLGAGGAARGHALDPGPHAPGGAQPAHRPQRREPVRQGRLCAGGDAGHGARCHPPGHRLGGGRGHGGAGAAGQGRHRGRRGLHALLGAVRGPARRLPRGGAGLRPARRGRGRGRLRLGALAGREGRLRRHGGLRRLGPGRAALRALRHNPRRRCRRRAQAGNILSAGQVS